MVRDRAMKVSYAWPDQYDAAFCFTIDVDAESPQLWRNRSQRSLSMSELEQRRYGMREGIWNLFEVLRRYEVRATCFVPVYEAETRPWLLESIAREGHEIGLHGVLHEVVSELSPDSFREIIERGIDTVVKQTGKRPKGFRSPAWEMTPWAFHILREKGIAYDSSLSGYDHPYSLDGIVELPVQWPLDDTVFFRFTGSGAARWAPFFTSDAARGWVEFCKGIELAHGSAIPTVHPWVTGRTSRIQLAASLLEHARNADRLWICTAEELAEYHASSSNMAAFSESAKLPQFDCYLREPQ